MWATCMHGPSACSGSRGRCSYMRCRGAFYFTRIAGARCQFTTVRGVTKPRGFLHPDQHVLNTTQNSSSRAVNRRRGCFVRRASNCWRRARFSRKRSSRDLKGWPEEMPELGDHGKNRIGSPESSFAPSHSFCGCTTIWQGASRGLPKKNCFLGGAAAYDARGRLDVLVKIVNSIVSPLCKGLMSAMKPPKI